MEPHLMPGAFFGWAALSVSLGIIYLMAGYLLAIARLRAWDTFGDTIAKTIIAPVASLEQDGPDIKNSAIYCAMVTLFWPVVLAWNTLTLVVLAMAVVVALAIIAVDYAIDALNGAAATAWRNARRRQHAAVRFLSASPARRVSWKIQRLLPQSRRLHEAVARARIRAASMDAKINALTDSLPAPETGVGPYRSAEVRAVP